MFLSSDDIFELTGFKRTASQIKWLRTNGIRFLIGGDGKPRVLESQIESLIGVNVIQSNKIRTEPNFKNLEKLVNASQTPNN